jgi:hypothetical protein
MGIVDAEAEDMDIRVLLVGGVVFPLVCAASAGIYVPRIEDDLSTQSREALGAANVRFDTVAFSGRDATITLARDQDRPEERAEQVVSAVEGVRTVKTVLANPAWKAPPTAKRNPWLRTTVSNDFAELVGLLPPDVDLERIRAAVSASLGGINVREAVTRSPADVSAPWVDAYLAAVQAAQGRTLELSFEVKGKRAHLGGTVSDDATRDAVIAAVNGEIGSLTLESKLVVRPPTTEPPSEKTP